MLTHSSKNASAGGSVLKLRANGGEGEILFGVLSLSQHAFPVCVSLCIDRPGEERLRC